MTENKTTLAIDTLENNTLPSLDYIDVIGARVHNLKNVSLQIPRNKLVVITGISGSGLYDHRPL